MLAFLAGLSISAALVSCHSREAIPSNWLEVARRAQREGKTSVNVPMFVEMYEGGRMRDVLRTTTVVVATPLAGEPQVTFMESYLMTWRVLHIDERLATGTPLPPLGVP